MPAASSAIRGGAAAGRGHPGRADGTFRAHWHTGVRFRRPGGTGVCLVPACASLPTSTRIAAALSLREKLTQGGAVSAAPCGPPPFPPAKGRAVLPGGRLGSPPMEHLSTSTWGPRRSLAPARAYGAPPAWRDTCPVPRGPNALCSGRTRSWAACPWSHVRERRAGLGPRPFRPRHPCSLC